MYTHTLGHIFFFSLLFDRQMALSVSVSHRYYYIKAPVGENIYILYIFFHINSIAHYVPFFSSSDPMIGQNKFNTIRFQMNNNIIKSAY